MIENAIAGLKEWTLEGGLLVGRWESSVRKLFRLTTGDLNGRAVARQARFGSRA